MSVIITDANLRTALYTIRSLGRRGIEITATEEKDKWKIPIGFISRYCRKKIRTPPVRKEKEFIKFMMNLSESYEAILPCGVNTMLSLSKYLDEFNAQIPIPPYRTLIKAVDKEITFKIAMENNIPCPKTFFPKNRAELEEIADRISYPAVVKIRKGSTARGVFYANSKEELIRRYIEAHNIQEGPIIQEYIKGRGYGAFALYNKSKVRAVFVHKRIREYPITGGPSSYCESVRESKVLKYGLKLLNILNWHGVAMVEFKIDERDGTPKLMEINPRFWGSMPLAIVAGVDFPYLLYKMAVDGDVQPVMDYKIGVRIRFVLTDIMACLNYFIKTNNIKYLKEIIYPFFDKNTHCGIFACDDPVPFIQYSINRLLRFGKSYIRNEK